MPEIVYSPLDNDTSVNDFVCGDGEIDKWLRKKALKEHCAHKHIVTCAHLDDTGEFVGFYALSSVIEEANKLPSVTFFPFGGTKHFPCVQLVYLAVQNKFQRNPELRAGSTIMGQVVRSFAEVGALIGIPALILTPLSKDVAKFYEALGFEYYDKNTRMFLPVQSAIAAVQEAQAEPLAEA